MELDDLKNDWISAHNQAHEQNILTSKIINEMTQKKYQSKIKKIKYPELTGTVVCILAISYICFNFNKLDTLFFQSIGVLAALLLLVMPALSFFSLYQFDSASNFAKPYNEIIKQFANQKLRFIKFRKVHALLSYLLLVSIIFLFPKFFYGKDLTFDKTLWVLSFTVGYLFLRFFSGYVNKCYKDSLRQAEELLKEVQA
ncbi:MAG: hypothetical protein JSS98_18820 [Bacteroidetes bacterium]|nr:hypothetical protein [Bacteroidota bacterium]